MWKGFSCRHGIFGKRLVTNAMSCAPNWRNWKNCSFGSRYSGNCNGTPSYIGRTTQWIKNRRSGYWCCYQRGNRRITVSERWTFCHFIKVGRYRLLLRPADKVDRFKTCRKMCSLTKTAPHCEKPLLSAIDSTIWDKTTYQNWYLPRFEQGNDKCKSYIGLLIIRTGI